MKDIGPLVKIISHDLRGPLGNLKNIVALFKTGELEMEQAKMFMEHVEVGVDRSLKLLDDLIEWSLASSDTKKVTKRVVNLSEVLSYVREKLIEDFTFKGVNLEINDAGAALGFYDEAALRVVLKNLLSNALHFTNSGGEVSVTVLEEGDDLIVAVKDSGIGVPEKMHETLFGMGKDNRRLGTNDEKGTGIGLFIVSDLVSRNNSRVWLDSTKEGGGSTFKFTVPKATETQIQAVEDT
ncbi:MAG: hypothetical protein Tsb0034_01750 [Ekhidna sp.]